jgi:hypothetical protein
MRRAVPFAGTALALGSLLLAGPAAGNGRSPPRPAGTAILTAACELRGNGERLEMVRPRLAGPGMPEGALVIRTDGSFAPVYLDLIRRIEIEDGATPDEEGTVAARLQRADGETATGSERVMVQAGAGNTPVRLSGFRPDGTRVEVELGQCRRLEFAVVGEGPVARPPLGPKAD